MHYETKRLIEEVSWVAAVTAIVIALVFAATFGALTAGKTAADVRKAHIEAGHVQTLTGEIGSDPRVIWTKPELVGIESE